MNLEEGVAQHQHWKVKLRRAIADRAQMDAALIGCDTRCEVGGWLHGEAKAKYGSIPAYAECVEAHRRFHAEVKKVAELINAGHYDQAEAALGAGTPYAEMSSAISVAFLRMKKAMAA